MSEHKRGSIPYVAGLDGLRAFALIAMLLFHLEFPWAPGALFGVSLFFTISGYLITQLLLHEMQNTGKVDLLRFWSRRVRRLLPAAAVCLALVVVLSLVASPFANASTRGDVLAAVFNVSNWRFVATGSSYDDLFLSKPSPLAHFWSLAVEEQFYLVLPLMAAVAARHKPIVFRIVIASTAAASLVAIFVTKSHTLIYYGTHTRAFELLAGALLAFAVPLSRPLTAQVTRFARLASLPALTAYLVLVATTSSTDAWLYRGGLPAFSLVSVAMIVGVCADTPLRRVAELKAMVWIGRMSYGLYVFHWPIFRFLTAERLQIDGLALAIVRICVTGGVAIASYTLIETHIRHPQRLRTRGHGVGAYAITTAVLLSVLVAAPGVDARTPTLAGLKIDNAPVLFATPAPTPAATAPVVAGSVQPSPTTVAPPTVKILLLGNQPDLAQSVGAIESPRYVIELDDQTDPGCPIVVVDLASLPDHCVATQTVLTHRDGYDLVVVGTGILDRADLPADTTLNQENRAIAYGLLDPAIGYLNSIISGGVPLVLVDRLNDDALGVRLRDLDIGNPNISLIAAADPIAALTTVIETQTKVNATARTALRTLVIGDSTSFGVASALARAAGDRMQVLWGGGQNCPVVPVAELRWWDGAQWSLDRCPTTSRGWPDLVSGFQPDLVFIVASLPEQSDQRYAPNGPWYTAGDSEFIVAHNEAMGQLQQLLASSGAVTVVATAPAVVNGAFAGGSLGSTERIADWNAQIASWDQQWNSVGTLDWSTIVATAEAAGYHRPDGIHFEQDPLDQLAKTYLLDELLAAAEALATQSRGLGCLTADHHLDLSRCAAALPPANG